MSVNMDEAEFHDEQAGPEPLGLAPDSVEVRRNAGVAALVGATASAVAIAYLGRAAQTGAVLDWVLVGVMGLLGAVYLWAFVDARTPLLVADSQGVRIRLGRTWRGLPWGALKAVEHQPRRGVLRDGRLVLVAHSPQRVLGELDAGGLRQTWLSERMYGVPFAVPLGLSTRVTGAADGLTAALERLAEGSTEIVETVATPVEETADTDQVEEPNRSADAPEWVVDDAEDADDSDDGDDADDSGDSGETDRQPSRWSDPRPVLAAGIGVLAERLRRRADAGDEESVATPLVPSATPSPLRATRSGLRAEIRSHLSVGATSPDLADPDGSMNRQQVPEARELRRRGSVNLVEETQTWGDRVRPISREGSAVEPLVIDDFAVEPADDPVVGPQLAAARTRLGLTVDQLADRTRIRPHVIESIEVDDFAPCGGDFYARGHLRTLARVLGTDVAPLLAGYDERYADAPINARRVFEAELATGAHGSIRGTRGGPNWSILIAAIMTLVLAWSIARLVMDAPVELRQPAPILNGSAGVNNGARPIVDPVPVTVSAVQGGAHVVVRNGDRKIVFSGDLAQGESKQLDVVPPVRVQASDGGAVETTIAGASQGRLGEPGAAAQDTFPVD